MSKKHKKVKFFLQVFEGQGDDGGGIPGLATVWHSRWSHRKIKFCTISHSS